MDVLLVDGYNIIGDWDELKRLRDIDLDQARQLLIERMAEYQAYLGIRVIIVFDAYEVKGLERKYRNYNIDIIFTKENETADEKIEKLAVQLTNRRTKVFVATSDYAEQWVIFGQGAFRKSARDLYNEIQEMEKNLQTKLDTIQERRPLSNIPLSKEMLDYFEKLRRGQ